MAINWGKTWSQLNDEEALKSRKATGGIDWDTTRKHIEKEQVEAHQAEVKAAVQASKQQEKLKQRKLQTAPFAARAAETLAGLQEGSEIQKLHPTGGPLSVSQDTLRDLGMVNENGFVLGGVDPGKLGLDAADMAKLGLPASSVAASGGATFPAKAGKAGVFGGRDYAGYLAGEFGAGMMSSPSGIMGGATTAIGDLATGGQVSAGAQTLANYFAQKPQMLQRWMTNEIGVEQMIMNETGVSAAAIAAYRAANTDDWLRGQLQQATGANLPQGYKDAAGNIAYTLGQQAPGFVYSMGAPAADGGGILSSVASAIKNKSGVGRALASSTKGALKGNVNTWLIGAGAAGNQLTELAKQRGYDPVNYINAMGNGFVEYISEGLLGFSDGGSIKALWRATGSKTGNTLKSVARWLMSSVEEGLEEVINVPMSGIVDKMTVEPDKKLVGEGGIFDLKEMLRAGIMGATVGMIMGGVGAVCSIHSAVLEGASIFDAATATNHLIDTIPKDMRPAHIDPKTATAETLEQKQAEVLEKLKEAEEASSTTGFAGGPPSPQAGKALAEDRQNTANQQVVDISQVKNQQGFEQAQNMPVQRNAQEVDVNQEVLNNEQGQVLSGNGPQRGFAAADAGGAGAVERAGTAASARRTQSAIAAERTARAQSAYLTPVSARELGLESGTDVRRNILLDDDGLLDDELRQIKQHWDELNRTRREKYGNTVDTRINFVLGKIQVEDMNGGMTLVDGVVNDNGEVFVQVNGTQRSATELADHEEYHLLEAETPGLTRAIWNAVSEDGLNDAMIERYRRFYTETLGYSDEMVREEILADAYAGLERIRGTNMQSVRDLVRKYVNDAQEAIEQGWYDSAAEEAYESVDGDGSEKARFSVADAEEQTDSEGRKLSAQQAEFFRDSKVRVDEYGDYGEQDGSLVPVYHATWNDEFTVFDADRIGEYTDKNAMDDWFAATAHVGFWFNTQNLSELKKVGKRSEKVYLNIKRPYRAGTLDGLAEDIATCTEDYIEEDTPAERGSVFAKWLEWNGYDGVMLNDEELGGVSFVALYPEQIKRVSNTRPTEAADIRYSVASESDAEQEAAERPRRDLTPGQELTRKEHTLIKRAINQSKMQLRDIVPAGTKEAREVQQMQILDLAQKLWETGEITQENIDDAFEEIWLKSAMVDREMADQYSEVRHALRTGVTVSEALRKEITDYEQFRRANFGAFTIRGGEQSDVDVAYQELSTSYPNLFPADITEPADQLQQMADVAQRLKPVVRTMSEMYGDNVDAKAAMKADFVDLVRNMELEILHPVQEITKKQKDQKEAERVASYRQIYKEVMDEVFKVKQRETFEPNPEYWHEVADDAWERMNERAEAIQSEWLRSLTKEGFKGTESLDELGVRIAGSVADYHLVGQVLENHRAAKAIQRDIKKAETKLNATAKEKNYAAGIASGAFTEADISGDARPHVVLELADYYMMERAVGLDLISERRKNMYADVDYQVEKLMSDKATYRVSPSPVLFYRTPQRNMIKIYGREHGQKVYDYLFAPVAENEAERIRWVNKMYDEVRLVEGSDGKKKQLNREERALVQLLMEGRAVAEVVAAMEEREIVYDAAANLRNGQDIEDIVRQFNLNQEMRNAVVDYATWLDTNDILETTKGIDQKKIDNAVVLYAKQYDKFYKAINDFLAAHGYEPIGFINGYAPHFQPERTKNMLEKTLTAMGLSSEVAKLPTAIAGLTHVYRPNKRWDPHFLKRRGKQTEYDVAAGYERYLDYLSDILFHMDDTVRIRRAANYFRREGAPQEITEQISHAEGMRMAPKEDKADFLRQMGSLSRDSNPSEKDVDKALDGLIDNMYKDWDDKGKYNSLVNWLEDYANQLTGKQSMVDRGTEILAGRTSLNFANKLNRAFQRANVAGNLSTALNQTAQLPMIVADIGHINTVRALFDYARGIARRDGFREKSDFLTARKGINNLVVDPADSIINIMFTPAQVADDMMSYAAVRGAYIKAVRQGMSDAEAMKYADRKAEQIMGSRAKGSAPQAFRSKNPLVRMVNMFQIEALNAFEYVEQDVIIQGIKDIKQIDDSKGRAKATAALIGLLGKMLVAAFLWNRTTEELYGGSPAQFDLLGYAANFLASGNGLTANEQLLDWIDMAWERAFGEPLFDIDPDYNEEFDWANATGDLGYAISSDIPFVRNIAGMLGIGDQSLPMPDLSTVYDAGRSLMSNGASPETLDAALTAAGQFLPGGRQINKTYQGARTMIRGGRYYGYGENERLQYPVEDTTSNWIKALLFGPSGLSETAEFYAAGGDDGLSAGNTRKYQELMQVGMSSEMALEVYEEYRRINRLETMTASEKATEFANTLYEMGVPEDQAELAREAFKFWGMVPGEATKYDTFVEGGLEPDMAYELTETLGELEPEDGKTSVSNLQKYQAVLEMTDVESTRYAALSGLMPDKELARLRAAYDYVQSGTYVEFLTAFDEAYPGESKSQERVETVLKQMRLDNEERAALWQMCGPKWKTDNNPFSKTVGREVARLIEEYYAEIDGE